MSRDMSLSQQRHEAAEKDLLYAKQKMREVKARESEIRAKWNHIKQMKENDLSRLTVEVDDIGNTMTDADCDELQLKEKRSRIEADETEAEAKYHKMLQLFANLYVKMMEKAKEWNEEIETEIARINKARDELDLVN